MQTGALDWAGAGASLASPPLAGFTTILLLPAAFPLE